MHYKSKAYGRRHCVCDTHVLHHMSITNSNRAGWGATMIIRNVFVAALIFGILSHNAFACGDSLYRVGKGISYRTYSAPIPGNLLVFAPSDGARQLAEELERSGHGVQIVSSLDELESELESGRYDVVIAPFSEHEMIESITSNVTDSDTAFLPVAFTREDEKLAKESYDRVMIPDKHEIKHYLKAIHIALKSKV